MQRLLLLAALAAGAVMWSAGSASAQQRHLGGAHPTSVTWPCVTPPGWYTNTYKHAWYLPWYAYYNYSQGPYSNWASGGGYASYAYCGPAGHYYWPNAGAPATGAPVDGGPAPKDEKVVPKEDKKPEKAEGRVSVTLPADATLLFNGTAATGTGAVRTFRTPALQPGQNYRYELTAEVVRDGRTERVTESVVVRAGETATVTLTPTGISTASAK